MCDSLGVNTSPWVVRQLFITPSCALSLSSSTTDVLCNGGSTGSIDLSVSGGLGSYTYLWSNGSTSEDIAGLSAGVYRVTVTDVTTGCTATASVSVKESPAIVVTNRQTICAGGSYAIGSNVYTSAGVYQDTLQSSNGCDSIVVTTLGVSSSLSVSISPSGPIDICSGTSASLSSSVQNPNFSYSWTDANGNVVGTTPRLSVSASGVYSLSVTTTSGCVASSRNSVTINVISLSAPSSLSTSNITFTSAKMNWGSVSGAHHYDVRIREVGTTSWQLLSNIFTTNKIKYGLTQSSSYEWQVRTACTSDSSSVSSWSSVETFSTLTPCAVPTNPSSTTSWASATLSWDAVSAAWGYRVRYKVQGGSWVYDTVNTNSINLLGLNTLTYIWQVKSMCDSLGTNSSVWTLQNTFTLFAFCDAPTSLSTTNITSANATLNWNSVSGANHFEIRWREVGSNWNSVNNIYSNSRTINNLTIATDYEWQVRTYCSRTGSSISLWSSVQQFSTPAPCLVPSNASTSSITATSATLNWSNVGNAIGYKIKWRKRGGPVNIDTVWNTNSFTISTLVPSASYKWRVKSICDTSASASSNFTSWVFFNTTSSAKISQSENADDLVISSVHIYPNPSKGMMNIEFDVHKSNNLEIYLLDALGNIVSLDKLENYSGFYKSTYQLSNYKKGMYIIKINTGKMVLTRRIVLQ